MPVHVTIVNADQNYANAIADEVRKNGHSVVSFADPLTALQFIEDAAPPGALITGVRFGTGRLHGVALGLMARWKHPGTKLLFLVSSEDAEHAREVGPVVPTGTDAAEVAALFERLLLED